MSLAEWAGFFAAEVSACATLVGLVTVAISINLARILQIPHLPARAGESLFALTVALTICGAALFPGISPTVLGALALALAAACLAFNAFNQVYLLTKRDLVAIDRQAIGALGRVISTGPLAIGGALLLLHSAHGLEWIASGVVATLAVSVMNAWVLLVEIIR